MIKFAHKFLDLCELLYSALNDLEIFCVTIQCQTMENFFSGTLWKPVLNASQMVQRLAEIRSRRGKRQRISPAQQGHQQEGTEKVMDICLIRGSLRSAPRHQMG